MCVCVCVCVCGNGTVVCSCVFVYVFFLSFSFFYFFLLCTVVLYISHCSCMPFPGLSCTHSVQNFPELGNHNYDIRTIGHFFDQLK